MVHTYRVCMSIFALQSFIKRSCWLRDLKDQAKAGQPHPKSLDRSRLWSVVHFSVSSYVTLPCFLRRMSICLFSAWWRAHRNTCCKYNTQWRLSHRCHHSSLTGLTRARTVIQSPWWPCSVWHKCYLSGGQAVPVLCANDDSGTPTNMEWPFYPLPVQFSVA